MSTERVTPRSSVDLLHCIHCLRRPVTVRTLLDSRIGQSVQMFECECGERNWQELPRAQSGIAGD
ncbi:hypothetical protein [Bradyrhizobium sp.]|uniref:hypothetical protein n=1 Tax=Bradyrhizobium sp. TaxID=376 RepID=UPI0026055636|nr:hypothetical protein [Bradyrhizobium sp.]